MTWATRARASRAPRAACLVALLLSTPAYAQLPSDGPPVLALDLRKCPSVAQSEVRSVVSVELRRPVVLADDIYPHQATAVGVVCSGWRADVTVNDALTSKSVIRSVDLAATAPVARPHLLALSIVELLAATWLELRSRPASETTSAEPQTRAERDAALDLIRRRPELQADVRRTFRTAVFGIAQQSTSRLRSQGAAAAVAAEPLSYGGWVAELSFLRGNETFSLGRISADSISTMGAMAAKVAPGPFIVRAGLGVRGGFAWLSGIPAAPPTIGGAVRGTWWGPLALLDCALPLGRSVFLDLNFETGYVVRPVSATVQGDRSTSIDGFWFRGGFGVGLAL